MAAPNEGVDGARTLEPRPVAPLFRALFEAEFSYVASSLYRLGVRRDDLEDLAHEVFVVVHRLLAEYDPSRRLRPWLFGITFRIASDYRRRARFTREIPHEHGPDLPSDAPGADDQLAAEQVRRLVIRALQELEIDRRAVLVMHDLDGCPMPEIAEALSIPVNTAYSRLRLGREQLKAAIKRLRLQRGEV